MGTSRQTLDRQHELLIHRFPKTENMSTIIFDRYKKKQHEEQQGREIQGHRKTKDLQKFYNKICLQRYKQQALWSEYFRGSLTSEPFERAMRLLRRAYLSTMI